MTRRGEAPKPTSSRRALQARRGDGDAVDQQRPGVVAVANGTVVSAPYDAANGRMVRLRHAGGSDGGSGAGGDAGSPPGRHHDASVSRYAGSTHVVLDVVGYFAADSP